MRDSADTLVERFIDNYEVVCQIEELTLCPKNKVFGARYVFFGGEEDSHPDVVFRRVLHTLVAGRISYRACVAYGSHHACNLIPVMIGTPTEARLTAMVHAEFRARLAAGSPRHEAVHVFLDEYKVPDLRHALRSYCVDDGHLGVLPSLLMNNREKLHHYVDRVQKNCRVLYMYNFMDRGSVLKLWEDRELLFRNQNGLDHVGKTAIDAHFRSSEVIGVDDAFTFNRHDWLRLNISTRRIYPIDSFHNKIVLTPAVIMFRALMRCRHPKNVTVCRARIAAGQFHFFLSQTANFQLSQTHHGSNMIESFPDSNLVRRPLAHQIGALHDNLFQVTRVTKPYMKLDQPFPTEARGFFCNYYFSSNISNFAKTLSLVEDVVVNFHTIDVITQVMRFFDLEAGRPGAADGAYRIKRLDRDQHELHPSIIPGHVIVQECVASVFVALGDLKALLVELKRRFRSALDITVEEDTCRVYINSIAGTAMKRTPSEVWAGTPGLAPLDFTALELMQFFPEYYASTSFPIHSLPTKVLRTYNAYEEPAKSITAASQLRNKLAPDTMAGLFNFTNEITGTYLGTDPRTAPPSPVATECVPVRPDGSFSLKTMICADLDLNEDAYVLNERLNFNVLIKRKYNINLPFDLAGGDRLVLERNPVTHEPEPKVVYKYDRETGAPIAVTFVIGTLYTKMVINRVLIYKINFLKMDENVYLLYRHCDHSDILRQTDLKATVAVYPSKNTHPSNYWTTNSHDGEESSAVAPDVADREPRLPSENAEQGEAAPSLDTTLYMYLYIEYRLPWYDGFKLCNYSGQKGICSFKNLSAYAVNGIEPDVLVSAVSVVGRKPLPQLKEMAHGVVAVDPENPERMIAYSTYFALKNRAMDMAISCNIKIDNLTSIVMSMNNLNYSLFHKSQEAQPLANYNPISRQIQWVGFMYAPTRVGLQFNEEDYNRRYWDNFIQKVNEGCQRCLDYVRDNPHD